jgi:hypothetical protein
MKVVPNLLISLHAKSHIFLRLLDIYVEFISVMWRMENGFSISKSDS